MDIDATAAKNDFAHLCVSAVILIQPQRLGVAKHAKQRLCYANWKTADEFGRNAAQKRLCET